MSQINPFGFAFIQSVQTQRDLAVDKERQIRKEEDIADEVVAKDDTFEHQVESAEEVQPVNVNAQKPQSDRKPTHGQGRGDENEDDDTPHLDLTA